MAEKGRNMYQSVVMSVTWALCDHCRDWDDVLSCVIADQSTVVPMFTPGL